MKQILKKAVKALAIILIAAWSTLFILAQIGSAWGFFNYFQEWIKLNLAKIGYKSFFFEPEIEITLGTFILIFLVLLFRFARKKDFKNTLRRPYKYSQNFDEICLKIRKNYLTLLERETQNRFDSSIQWECFKHLSSEERKSAVQPLVYQSIIIEERDDPRKFKNFSTAFEHFNARILLLGEPGAGKTTTLIEFTKELAKKAILDKEMPVPVFLNISTFDSFINNSNKNINIVEPIESWILGALINRPGVTSQVAKSWIKNEKYILILDGLDEVAENDREILINRLNFFLKKHPTLPVVISSRPIEYQVTIDKNKNKLNLEGAVKLAPLTPTEINQYLISAKADGLSSVIADDTFLLELTKTPLILSMVTLAFKELDQSDIPLTGSLAQRRVAIFDKYVEQMTQRAARRKHNKQYDSDKKKDVQRDWPLKRMYKYLGWLAINLSERGRNEFDPLNVKSLLADNKLTGDEEFFNHEWYHYCAFLPLFSLYALGLLYSGVGSVTIISSAIVSFSLVGAFIYSLRSLSKQKKYYTKSFLLKWLLLAFFFFYLNTLLTRAILFVLNSNNYLLSAIATGQIVTMCIYISIIHFEFTPYGEFKLFTNPKIRKSHVVISILIFIVFEFIIIFFTADIFRWLGVVSWLFVFLLSFSIYQMILDTKSHLDMAWEICIPVIIIPVFLISTTILFFSLFLVNNVSDWSISFIIFFSIIPLIVFRNSLLYHFFVIGSFIVGRSLANEETGLLLSSISLVAFLPLLKLNRFSTTFESLVVSPAMHFSMALIGNMPWRKNKFYKWCNNSFLLKTNGKKYEFMHRMIRDHFAVRSLIRILDLQKESLTPEILDKLSLQGEAAHEALKELTGNEDLNVRKCAIKSLSKIRSTEASETLKEVLKRDPINTVRIEVLKSATRLPSDSIAQLIYIGLKDGDVDVRREAANTLQIVAASGMSVKPYYEIFKTSLSDIDSVVRLLVILSAWEFSRIKKNDSLIISAYLCQKTETVMEDCLFLKTVKSKSASAAFCWYVWQTRCYKLTAAVASYLYCEDSKIDEVILYESATTFLRLSRSETKIWNCLIDIGHLLRIKNDSPIINEILLLLKYPLRSTNMNDDEIKNFLTLVSFYTSIKKVMAQPTMAQPKMKFSINQDLSFNNVIQLFSIYKESSLGKFEITERGVNNLLLRVNQSKDEVCNACIRLLTYVGTELLVEKDCTPLYNKLNDKKAWVRASARRILLSSKSIDPIKLYASIKNDSGYSDARYLVKLSKKEGEIASIARIQLENKNLKDFDSAVRILGYFGDESDSILLHNILNKKSKNLKEMLSLKIRRESLNVRSSAAIALGRIGIDQSIHYLVKIVSDKNENEDLRFTCFKALLIHKSDKAISKINDCLTLEDTSSFLKRKIIDENNFFNDYIWELFQGNEPKARTLSVEKRILLKIYNEIDGSLSSIVRAKKRLAGLFKDRHLYAASIPMECSDDHEKLLLRKDNDVG